MRVQDYWLMDSMLLMAWHGVEWSWVGIKYKKYLNIFWLWQDQSSQRQQWMSRMSGSGHQIGQKQPWFSQKDGRQFIFSQEKKTWEGKFVNTLPCLHCNSLTHSHERTKAHTTHNQQNYHPRKQMLSVPQLINLGLFAWMLMRFLRDLQSIEPSTN